MTTLTKREITYILAVIDRSTVTQAEGAPKVHRARIAVNKQQVRNWAMLPI